MGAIVAYEEPHARAAYLSSVWRSGLFIVSVIGYTWAGYMRTASATGRSGLTP